jgi:aryl-alcohol dehydrogenase-like predicted oxidoreductase
VRAIGASNYNAERLKEALQASQQHGYPSYQSLQPNYNLYDRAEYEGPLEAVCRQNGLGVIPYFPLASGFLTGKYRSESDLAASKRGQFVKKYFNDRGLQILRALDGVARQVHSTPASVSLAWLLARPCEQLKGLIAATELKLDRSSLDTLDKASAYTESAANPI